MTTQYTYNGDGDRMAQIVAGIATNYALDPTGLAQVLIETTGGQNTHYLPGLAQNKGNAWNYYLPDRLGSVRQLTDPTSAVLLAQSFDPFGNRLEQTGAGQSVFGYTGEQTDPSGLMFLRARFYNPGIGRFLTADSIVPDPSRSMGWNRYAYGGNNPVNRADPSGHCIVQYSGEVRMGQAPYGTSGLCLHTESVHIEGAYAVTAMYGDPGTRLPFPSKELYRAYVRSLLPESWRETYDMLCIGGDIFEQIAAIGMLTNVGGLGGGFGGMPLGFGSADEFAQFGSKLYAGLGKAGIDDATAIFQGSSVTGVNSRTGAAFDVGRVSDFDIALASPTLLERAKELGIGLRSLGTRTGPLKAVDLQRLGLTELSRQLGEQAGRPVNFMIYDSVESAVGRSSSIIVPCGVCGGP